MQQGLATRGNVNSTSDLDVKFNIPIQFSALLEISIFY